MGLPIKRRETPKFSLTAYEKTIYERPNSTQRNGILRPDEPDRRGNPAGSRAASGLAGPASAESEVGRVFLKLVNPNANSSSLKLVKISGIVPLRLFYLPNL